MSNINANTAHEIAKWQNSKVKVLCNIMAIQMFLYLALNHFNYQLTPFKLKQIKRSTTGMVRTNSFKKFLKLSQSQITKFQNYETHFYLHFLPDFTSVSPNSLGLGGCL